MSEGHLEHFFPCSSIYLSPKFWSARIPFSDWFEIQYWDVSTKLSDLPSFGPLWNIPLWHHVVSHVVPKCFPWVVLDYHLPFSSCSSLLLNWWVHLLTWGFMVLLLKIFSFSTNMLWEVAWVKVAEVVATIVRSSYFFWIILHLPASPLKFHHFASLS